MQNKNIGCEDTVYIPLDDYKNFYYCSDIDIGATLVTKNIELVSIDKIGGTKVTFIFKNHPDIKEMVEGFWSNKIEVHPLEFANARKNLKSRIFAMKSN